MSADPIVTRLSAASRACPPLHVRNSHGFTLLELLTVLTIVGMLALLAYPLYTDSIIKARRAEAASALLRAMQQQELHYAQHNRYIAYHDSAPPEAPALLWFSGENAASSAYQISAAACDGHGLAQCVTLSATPGGALVDQDFRDELCGTLTLNSRGEKTANGQSLDSAPHACH